MVSLDDDESGRIEATSAEFKALANQLRLRMIRLCLYEALTNKQLADRLDLDPATSLHHVRTLVRAGMLEPEAARTGEHGALEKPYRTTMKSWRLAILDPDDELNAVVASVDALRAELIEAGPSGVVTSARLGLQLSEEEATELGARLKAVADEYVQRPPTPNGRRVGLFIALHQLREGDD